MIVSHLGFRQLAPVYFRLPSFSLGLQFFNIIILFFICTTVSFVSSIEYVVTQNQQIMDDMWLSNNVKILTLSQI